MGGWTPGKGNNQVPWNEQYESHEEQHEVFDEPAQKEMPVHQFGSGDIFTIERPWKRVMPRAPRWQFENNQRDNACSVNRPERIRARECGNARTDNAVEMVNTARGPVWVTRGITPTRNRFQTLQREEEGNPGFTRQD